ncbi:hypothetical protein [Nostoc sp. CMAA1605]
MAIGQKFPHFLVVLLYEEKVYVGDNAIASLVFPVLKLTAAQVLHCH